MAKKDRLKNGLDLLFEDNFHDESEEAASESVQKDITKIRLSLIEPDKNQPRKNFDAEKLQELADNISLHGVLQPILVRPLPNGSYKIVAGERRWRASRIAGLTEVPVIIRELSDSEAAQISLIENLQREDLNPIEEAKALSRLISEFNMRQEQVANAIGKSRAAVTNSLRLLRLDPQVQKMVEDKQLSLGHAKIICGVDQFKQFIYAQTCVNSGMTVRKLEEWVNSTAEEKPPKPKKTVQSDFGDPFKKFSVETAMSFKQLYGIDTRLAKEKNGGYSMKFNFSSEAELKEMIARLADKFESK